MSTDIQPRSRSVGDGKTATVGNINSEELRRRLQLELVKRCERNPKYSLRSFARTLDLDPSTLSQILRGKRRLAPSALNRIAKQLGWQPTADLAQFELSKKPDPTYHSLTLDAFAVIADWYHFALSQLLQLSNIDHNPKTLPKTAARALGITVSEVRVALERLERLEIIELVGDRYTVHEGNLTTTSNEFTAAAYRKLQRQLLEKSVTALEEIPMTERDQTSMTMRMNPARLTEARERLRKFRREFCAEFENDPGCSEVYQLCLSYFPLTQIKSSKTSIERNPSS